jgi:uncharacterized protein (DUF2249 family)
MKKELIQIPRTTLDIYKYNQNDLVIYEFDATECSPPEPMVNTVVVLDKIKDENERLIVTYFHEPTPLYERISNRFIYEAVELDNGDVNVTFKRKID